MNFLKPELNTGLPDISFNGGDVVVGQLFADQLDDAALSGPRRQIRPHGDALGTQGLRAAGCFLGELHARGQAQLGVDVGEVSLHSAGRDEKPCGDVVIGESFAD